MDRRYFIQFSFKGTRFHGWQLQPNATSVQEIMNRALSAILQENIKTTGAGRTDSGVHASFFTAHFDYSKPIDAGRKNSLIKSLNSILPVDIAVSDIYEVIPDAHARFSAIERTYEYTILRQKNPFYYEFGWFYKHDLDTGLMNEAAKELLKYKDFTSFSKLHTDVKTNLCIIRDATWTVYTDKLLFRITADRFLRNMVRAIVGTMIDVGRNRINLNDFKMIIESNNRSNAGVSVPACGLVLTDIVYPVNIKLY